MSTTSAPLPAAVALATGVPSTVGLEAKSPARTSKPARVAQVVKACFDGRRIVVFSGGAAKDTASLLDEARAIRDGGGNGSIIGRNSFQRKKADALKMLDTIIRIYEGKLK